MSIRDGLRWAMLLHVAAAGLALALAGSETSAAGWTTIVISLAGVILGREWPRDARRRLQLWNVLALCALVLFLGELYLLRVVLAPVVHLVVFLTAYKIFNDSRTSDFYTTQMLTFLLVLAASSVSYDYGFAIPYALYVLFSCLSLILATLNAGRERAQLTRSLLTGLPASNESPRAPRHMLRGAMLTALIVLVVTVLVFPLLPRFRTDVLGSGRSEEGTSISGFSAQVDLDAISDIKQDPTVIMRVTLGDSARRLNQRPKIRGITLTWFDGVRWRHSFSGGHPVSRSQDGYFHLAEIAGGVRLEQEILLTPVNSRSIFHTGQAISVRGPFGTVTVDRTGSLFMWHKNTSRIRYTVFSAQPNYDPDVLRGIPLTPAPAEARSFLQFPDNNVFTAADLARIRQLALEMTAGQPDLYGMIQAIENHLRTDFGYTLQLSQYRGARNKMIAFLFDRKQGHCAYFASAMVLLVRSLGVPARIVNGFQLGQFNPVGNFYTVRAADAHSWVEVYFPGRGWVEFDPTPAGGQESSFAVSSPNFFIGLLESIDLAWTQYVLAFDAIDQGEFFSGVAQSTAGALNEVNRFIDGILALLPGTVTAGWIGTVLRVVIATALALAAIAAAWFLIIAPLRRLIRHRRGASARPGTEFFFKAVKLLRKSGHPLAETETARDLARNTAIEPYGPLVAEIVADYEAIRFAGEMKTAGKTSRHGDENLAELERELKRRIKKS